MLDRNKKSYRILPVNFLYQNGQPVPVIKLQGKWLQKLGFRPGDTLLVERQPGMLVIRHLLIVQNFPDSSTVSGHNVIMI
jgi:hypothetical protein